MERVAQALHFPRPLEEMFRRTGLAIERRELTDDTTAKYVLRQARHNATPPWLPAPDLPTGGTWPRRMGARNDGRYEPAVGDSAEAYLVACAESAGVGSVALFDTAIDRVTTVTRLEP